MTDRQFSSGYDEVTSLGLLDRFLVDVGGADASGWVSWASLMYEMQAERGPRLNVLSFSGVLGDGVNDDTAGIIVAYGAAVALGLKTLSFPAGTYIFDDDVLSVVDDNFTFELSFGAKVTFKNGGQWQFGSSGHTTSFPTVQGGIIDVDASSTVQAPIYAYSVGGIWLFSVTFTGMKKSAVDLRSGVVIMRNCEGRFGSGVGESIVNAAFPTTLRGAVFVQGGRFKSNDHANKALIRHTGAGTCDGAILWCVSSASIDHAIDSAPASGGKLSNCVVFGSLIDQTDQEAFKFAPAAGAELGDVTIKCNKVNGWVSSTATSGALISVDLTSGATHTPDVSFTVTDNVLTDARDRAFECKGGTLASLVFSRNTLASYGRRLNSGSRALYVAGTFSYLEVADNTGITGNTHDYDIEFGAVTAAKRRVAHNSFAGASVANLATYNQAAFDLLTVRPLLMQSLDLYVNPSTGSDTNAGRVVSSPFATRQKAWDVLAAHDLNSQAVAVHLADGTYTVGLIATKVPLGAGTITFDGNSVTPSNVLVSTTAASGYAFPTPMQATVTIQNQKFTTTTSGNAVNIVAAVKVFMGVGIEYGAMAGFNLSANGAGANITETATSKKTGIFIGHCSALNQGQVNMANRTHTIDTGATSYSGQYVLANLGGLVNASNMTFNGANAGSVTGLRGQAFRGAMVDTGTDTGSGPSLTYFPGNANFQTSPGGILT
jgi:hypothetical protein